jgi:hypothetical protein
MAYPHRASERMQPARFHRTLISRGRNADRKPSTAICTVAARSAECATPIGSNRQAVVMDLKNLRTSSTVIRAPGDFSGEIMELMHKDQALREDDLRELRETLDGIHRLFADDVLQWCGPAGRLTLVQRVRQLWPEPNWLRGARP